MSASGNNASPDRRVTSLRTCLAIAAGTILIYAAFAAYATVNGRIWIDEMSYLVKSWWYTTGAVRPYSNEDATWYMPLYFYQLGWAQNVFAPGHFVGRTMSAVFGAASAVLTFLICRRLTNNDIVSVAATAIYLLTPTTVYYFSTATPIATVAFLNVLAIYLILLSVGRPRWVISFALGLLFAMLFFYRQNMILAITVLAPSYIYVLGRARWRHAGLVVLGAVLITAPLLMIFPEKMVFYAIRLPLITPILQALSLLPESLRVVQEATETPYSLSLNPSSLSWRDPVNGFLLPYLGTVLLAAGLAIGGLRARRGLLALPGFFLFLALTHYIGSAGYCPACILTYTNYFVAVGVIAAAVLLDLIWRRQAARGQRPLKVVATLVGGAIVLNVFGTAFALPNAEGVPSPYRHFPFLLVHKEGPLTDLEETERLARIMTVTTPAGARVLVLHENTSMVFAAFRAGRTFPVQNLNLWQSYRQLRADISEADRAAAVQIIEGESYWTDETLRKWLGTEVDAVIIQDGITRLPDFTAAEIAAHFALKANAVFMGYPVRIHTRESRPNAQVVNPSAVTP